MWSLMFENSAKFVPRKRIRHKFLVLYGNNNNNDDKNSIKSGICFGEFQSVPNTTTQFLY